MTIRVLRFVFALVLVPLVILVFLPETPTIGLAAKWSDGHYQFAAGTASWAIVLALSITGLYILLMHARHCISGEPLPGLFRRFVSFWCDFIFAFFAIGPLLGLIPVLSEWQRTGVFAWNFVRTTPASGDTVLLAAGMLCGSVALVFYFALPLFYRRPSPGACVLGYQVIPDGGRTIALGVAVSRTLLGLVAVGGAWLAPFVFRDSKNGKFWLDRVYRTRAIKLS